MSTNDCPRNPPLWKLRAEAWSVLVLGSWGFLITWEARADTGWEPRKTWVFVVGVLEWKERATFQPFPKKGRQDAELVRCFQANGVPAGQITFLKDGEATRSQIQKTFVRQLSRTRKGDLLFFYYAGHGIRDHGSRTFYLANYDATSKPAQSAWPFVSVFETIERHFKGSLAILTSDCCFSGALAVTAKKRKTPIIYAVLTAADQNTISTDRWTFTECLLAGLRGNPVVDFNRDGQVTLEELARYTREEMAFREDQMAAFAVTRSSAGALRLARAARKPSPELGKHIEVEWHGQWYRARIEAVGEKRCKIHYNHYERFWDEWVGPKRIRPFAPRHLANGTRVSVQWSGKWYPAKVQAGWYGLHYVHYDQDTADWDEWVPAERIRPIKKNR